MLLNERFTEKDPRKARSDDEVSEFETVQLQTPTHSGRSAVTDVNEFDREYYRVHLWEKLKVSLVAMSQCIR